MHDGKASENDKAQEKKGAAAGTLSLPLYAGGLAVTLCGVQAVASTMNVPEITMVATLLTLLGFGFSLACRRLRVQPRVIEIACFAILVFGVYLWASQQIDLRWFLNGADKTEDRIAAGLMWSAVVWSWTLISDDNVMFSCVLSAAMIGLTGTSNVNTPIIVFFCLFMLAMLFLLIHHHDLQSRAGLPVPRSGAGSSRAQTGVQALMAVLCAAGVLGLAALVVVPAQAVFADLSLAQAVRQLVNAGKADAPAPLVATQFYDDVSLDVGRGSSWPTGTDTIMRVSASDGQPHYWRGRTYDAYTGDGWQSSLSVSAPLKWTEGDDDNKMVRYPVLGSVDAPGIVGETPPPPPAPLAPRTPPLRVLIEVRGSTNQFYYCDQPRDLWFDADGAAVPRLSPDGCLDLENMPVRMPYRLVCDPTPSIDDPDVQRRLRRAEGRPPRTVQSLYLRVLSRTDNSLTTTDDLAYYQGILHEIFSALPPARRAPVDKALAIRDWVASHCIYSLSVDALPDGVDHVRAFLDGPRTGYCDLFASSVVVLCRVAGIPARMATGFAPGEQDGTSFNLRAMDKHAWAEAYFPGANWLILDATVGSRADASVPTGRTEKTGVGAALWRSLTQSGPLPPVLILAIAGLLGWIGKTELWDKRAARLRPRTNAAVPAAQRARTAAGRQWQQMTRELGRLGLPRRPSETPAEFAARAHTFFGQQQTVTGVALPLAAIDTVTGHFTRSRYAPASGTGETDTAASRALSDLSTAARRARRRLLWHRLRRAVGAG